uniref:Uncharacterized protein n=1 Tax=Peronospora matthiolae TaxID=2874970 RepID=A0AAV1TRF7_9STRA
MTDTKLYTKSGVQINWNVLWNTYYKKMRMAFQDMDDDVEL